jgi:hypothetical protein
MGESSKSIAEFAAGLPGPVAYRLPGGVPGLGVSHPEVQIDWRTVDPETIRGEGIPAEELRYYAERIEELLSHAEGRYVLIVGREVISLFEDLDSAAGYAREHYGDRAVLIKKVAAVEPIHTLGGGVLSPALTPH